MGLKESTAIKHIGGNLTIISCHFRGTAGSEKLYEGAGESVSWISNISTGGEGMKLPGKLQKICRE